jgi:hypothetical protein
MLPVVFIINDIMPKYFLFVCTSTHKYCNSKFAIRSNKNAHTFTANSIKSVQMELNKSSFCLRPGSKLSECHDLQIFKR